MAEITIPPALLGTRDSAEYIGVSRSTIYALIESGELPSVTIGTRRLVARVDLDAFIERRRVNAQ